MVSKKQLVRNSVLKGFDFVENYLVHASDLILNSVLKKSLNDKKLKYKLHKDLHRQLRTSLPVPSIFVSLRILGRLSEYADIAAAAIEAGSPLKKKDLPKKEKLKDSMVDDTVEYLWRKWHHSVQSQIESFMIEKERTKLSSVPIKVPNVWAILGSALLYAAESNSYDFFGVSLSLSS